ncbi:MAG: BTAD domain-containing putative transcriptional regulator, partial [Acidimicrobiia bacterium]
MALRPRQNVSAERLIDLLWPDADDDRARHRLHTAVSKLRHLLAQGSSERGRRLIKWSPAGLVLDVADEQLDWLRFRRLVDAGERALRRGEANLAAAYLAAALKLWPGEEPLAGVEVASEDVGFISAQIVTRERAQRALLEACLMARKYSEVIPELEATRAANPVDSETVHRLALAYHWSGRPDLALAVCSSYLEGAGENAVSSIFELRSAILRRDPDIANPAFQPEVGLRRAFRETSGYSASLSCRWDFLDVSLYGPVSAELFWIVEAHGGENLEITEHSVDASFQGIRAALEASVAVQRFLGRRSFARVGIDVHGAQAFGQAFEAASRAQARSLALTAEDGQVLIADGDGDALVESSLPKGSKLRA